MIGSAAEQMTARPDRLSVRPNRGAAMDLLSELLGSVRLTGGIFLDAHFTAPWCVTANMTPSAASRSCRTRSNWWAFTSSSKASCSSSLGTSSPIKARAGEILLFPGNDGHILGSAQGLTPVSPPRSHSAIGRRRAGAHILRRRRQGDAYHLRLSRLGRTYNPLIAALPRVLTLDLRQGMARDWIETSVLFAANELAAGRMASSGVLSRLSETLLVEAVRQYSSTLADGSGSWLNGVKDPQIGRALALMHHKIGAPWSAESLAKEVAMSRSAFIDRFTTLVGMPPIRYLTVWRMQTAKQSLREKRTAIAQARAFGRLRIRGSLQPRVQARVWRLAPQWRDQQSAG